MFDLTGRKALITGASGGIGEQIARSLHSQGATLALSGTRVDKLEALAGELGGRTHVVAADLSKREEVGNLVAAAEQQMAGLDILVNNAGITRDGMVLRMKDEDWDLVMEVNLTAAFRLCRAAAKGMINRRYGRIIGITSVVGVAGNIGQGNYAAAKAGMVGLTKSLAREVASRNITVNAVAPGFIRSAMTDGLNDDRQKAIMANIPAGRIGDGDEVAAAVVYLASDEASYVTGQTLHVNGGMAMI